MRHRLPAWLVRRLAGKRPEFHQAKPIATLVSQLTFSPDTAHADLFPPEYLVLLVNTPMPFGKYTGRMLADLPEPYLIWFKEQGFPAGRLGQLMALALEIKLNGLEALLEPLRVASSRR